jgi:hypothetical protein
MHLTLKGKHTPYKHGFADLSRHKEIVETRASAQRNIKNIGL